MRITSVWLVALVALLAGCGGDASGAGAADGVGPRAGATPASTSADTSPAAPSASGENPDPQGQTQQGDPPADHQATDAGDLLGLLSAAARAQGSVRMEISGNGVNAKGVAQFGDRLSLDMSMPRAGGKVKFTLVDDHLYTKPDKTTNGKTWIKINPKGTDPFSKGMLLALDEIQDQVDLSRLSASLKGIKADTQPGLRIGKSSTSAYTVTLNSKELLATLSPRRRKALALQWANASSISTFYVDTQGLPLQIVTVTEIKGKTTTTTITYRNWGQAGLITAPPSAKVGRVGP